MPEHTNTLHSKTTPTFKIRNPSILHKLAIQGRKFDTCDVDVLINAICIYTRWVLDNNAKATPHPTTHTKKTVWAMIFPQRGANRYGYMLFVCEQITLLIHRTAHGLSCGTALLVHRPRVGFPANSATSTSTACGISCGTALLVHRPPRAKYK